MRVDDAIIRHVESLGYAVTCRVVGDTFVAVCKLAEAVGVELADG